MGLWRVLLAAVLFIALSGFRAPDGEIISDGDPLSKVLEHLGQPVHVSDDAVRPIGSEWVKRETWTYKLDRETYYLTVEGGKRVAARWSRVQ